MTDYSERHRENAGLLLITVNVRRVLLTIVNVENEDSSISLGTTLVITPQAFTDYSESFPGSVATTLPRFHLACRDP